MDTCPQHGDVKPQRRGQRTRKNGAVVVRYWCPADGGHSLQEIDPATMPRRRSVRYKRRGQMRCTNPQHADATVTKHGTQTNRSGVWQRWLCRRPNGDTHGFQTLKTANGSVVRTDTQPPDCPYHGSDCRVVRDGKRRRTDAKGAVSTHQSYQCTPGNGDAEHKFVLALPRETVHVGHDACAECEELLSPHRGTQAVARRNRYALKAVVQTLSDISAGTSYAQAAEDLHTRTARALGHLQPYPGGQAAGTTLNLPGSQTNTSSGTAKRRKNGWRRAADLTEQYAPLLWDHVNTRVKEREAAQRELNDRLLAANPGGTLSNPLVYVLDELPVVVHRRVSPRARYEQSRWHMLVVSEIRWSQPKPDSTPFDRVPMREPVLRLVRAYPGASEGAWRLVLDELDVRPDFIVSDFSSALLNAVGHHYPPGTVGHVPSFFHMARNIRGALLDSPHARTTVEGHKVVVEPLEKFLDVLTREDLVARGVNDWSDWWDGFLTTLAGLGVPTATFTAQRRVYEKPVGAAFAMLAANPHLPASNAAVESSIRMKLEPLLENRKQRFRNIGRVNALLDLVVCRAQGLFLDTDTVAGLIRDSNAAAGGWAPKAREVCDIHPKKTGQGQVEFPYSSLLDPFLTEALWHEASQTGSGDETV